MNTKMNHVISFGGLAAALLLSGCDNGTVTPPAGERTALQVTGGIHAVTRAYNNVWEAGDAIGIYMLDGAAAEAANRKYSTPEGNGSFAPTDPAQTVYFPVDGSKRDFIAYYPYRDLPEGSTAYEVDVADQSSQQAIDLMGADRVADKHKNDPAVAFAFAHKLVKLSLDIAPGAGLTAADLQGLTVTLTGQQTRASYDVAAGGAVAVTPPSDAAALASVALLTDPDGTHAEAIVLPAGDTAGMQLEFRLSSDETFRWAVSDAGKSSRFEAGSKYLYDITVNRTGVEVSAAITDWNAGNDGGETGSAE